MNHNFIRGICSAFTLFPRERKKLSFVPCTDQEAFENDLKNVGDDMYYAIQVVDESLDNNK